MFSLNGTQVFSLVKPVARQAGRLALALLVSAFLTSIAVAQRYDTIEAKVTERVANSVKSQVISPSLRDAAAFAANREKFDDYFKQYYFPIMTSTAADDLGLLRKRREDLFKQFIRQTKLEEVSEHLTKLTMAEMARIALGNYHPAARYNAVLILGNLDQKYSRDVGNNPTPPVPLPDATMRLLVLLEEDEVKGVIIPTSLKIGALVGLARHARFGIDPKYASQTTDAALQVIATQSPPEDVALEVHHWMKCQAARVLANQFGKGPTAEVLTALTNLIASDEMSLEDRCSMAELLKKMQFEGAQEIDSPAVLTALGNLAKVVAEIETESAEEYQEEVLGGNPGGGFSRGRSFGRGNQPQGPEYERRRMLTRFKSIHTGLDALQPALPPEHQEQGLALIEVLEPLITVAGEKDSLDITVVDQVITTSREIKQIVASWNQADQPAEGSDEDFS